MTETNTFMVILGGSAWLAFGALIGACYFATLRKNAQTLANGSRLLLVSGLQLTRFAILAGALGLVARNYGAAALLLTAIGVLAARTAVIRLGIQP